MKGLALNAQAAALYPSARSFTQKEAAMDTAATCNAEYTLERVLYMAIELADNHWKLGFTTGFGQRPRERDVAARDTEKLEREIRSAKLRFHLPGDCRVLSCYEAGREGFWLHRYLIHHGINSLIVDAGSMEARKKRRRAKTDRIDMEKMLRMLIRYHAGDKAVWSVVRVPSVDAEDRRQLHRERWALSGERNKHINRIKGLLATQGISLPVNDDLPEALEQVRTWDGSSLPPGLTAQLLREHQLLQLVDQQMKAIEQEQRQAIRRPEHPSTVMVRDLMQLKSIHIHTAWPLTMELFSWRQFQNSREIGALVGLEPVPYQSGETSREKGLSKCGNSRLRSLAVEFAWQWLIHQPDSELSRWYEKRFGKGSSRVRKIGIVALARKLLIALWRYLETGEIPKGACLKEVAV
jgi:transposase